MFFDGRESVEFELIGGKLKRGCTMINININVDRHQKGTSSVNMSPRYRIENQSGIVHMRYISSTRQPLARTHVWQRLGATRVTKPAVSRLLSEIQRSLCTYSVGNEPQNTWFFLFSIGCIMRQLYLGFYLRYSVHCALLQQVMNHRIHGFSFLNWMH